ncbi:MAG: hypothetical protein VXX08_02395 [Pseudomonadota bacterium]|nr:hypothetical protein [Pseudomonadota bacterium]
MCRTINVQIDFLDIVAKAWQDYDSTRPVCSVDDISVLVSTNHVFRVRLQNGDLVVAKLSYFGRYEHFVEDHSLINALANNPPAPFDKFLSRSLLKKSTLYLSPSNRAGRCLGGLLQPYWCRSNAAQTSTTDAN